MTAKLSEARGFVRVHWHRLLAATAVGVVFGALMYMGPTNSSDTLYLPRYAFGVVGFVCRSRIWHPACRSRIGTSKATATGSSRERRKLVREAAPMTDDLKLAFSIIRRPFIGTLVLFSFPISFAFLLWLSAELKRDTDRMNSMWGTMYPKEKLYPGVLVSSD